MCKWMSKHTLTKPHRNSESLRNDFGAFFTVYFQRSPLTFWCKFCIPLGTSFELLCLLFRRYKFCIPLGTSFELLRLLFRRYKFCIPLGTTFELLRLIFRWYLALHSLRNDFWAENLRCVPLGTTFCSFVVLCIPLGTTFELLPGFFFFCTRWCPLRCYILHSFGGFCSRRAE